MEKGLWCYEANVAEPSHLHRVSQAGLQSYYTITAASQTGYTGTHSKDTDYWTMDLQRLL